MSQTARVEETKGRIFKAVITCLDQYGYSETSVNRVQTTAGVSRGALTHHFHTKEEMMVETLETLLAPVRGDRATPSYGGSIKSDLIRLWDRVVNTREGRALFEILVAARTDRTLRDRITPSLRRYDTEVSANILATYAAAEKTSDVATLWAMSRTFLRGLHVQRRFDPDPRTINKLIETFADVVAPHFDALDRK